MTQYLIDVPNQNPSLPRMIIKSFNHFHDAAGFCERNWQAPDGLLSLIFLQQEYFNVCVPNPYYYSEHQKFLVVEGFQHHADALDFAIANYAASTDGYINLIKVLT